jgi:hypothetical protein
VVTPGGRQNRRVIDVNTGILRTVSDTEAFYFCRGLGNFSGKKANSLEDFLGKIQIVDFESLEFHVGRGDFEKWIASTIGYPNLVADLQLVKSEKLTGEALRNRLFSLVSTRIMDLASAPKASKGKRKRKQGVAKNVQ